MTVRSGPRLRRTVVTLAAAAIVSMPGVAAHADGPTPTPIPAPAPHPGDTPPPVTSPQPSPTPVPAPPGPSPTPPPPGEGDGRCDHAWYDVVGRVRDAINCWFRGLVVDGLNPFLSMLGRSLMATPDATQSGDVRSLWLISAGIANGFFVVLLLVGGLVAMGYETVQTRFAVKDLLPRIAVGWIGANVSLELAHEAITTANGFSQAFLGAGVDPERGADGFKQLAVAALTGGPLRSLLGIGLIVLSIALLGVYAVRVATVVVLVAAAPLCLSGHVLPATNGAARMWWRALAGCLGVQVAQSLTLIATTRVFFDVAGRSLFGWPTGGLMDLVVLGALLWLLLKIPSYAGRLVFNNSGNAGLRVVKTVVVSRAVGAAMRGVR